MNKKDITKLKEAWYNTTKLKIKGVVKKENQSLKSFLYLLLTEYNNTRDTIEADTGKIECKSERLRSLGDIFRICSYYYPGVRMQTVKEALLDFGPKLVGHFCETINRRVYTHLNHKPKYVQCSVGQYDEFGELIQYKNRKGSIYK